MCFYAPFGSKEMWDWHTTNNRLVGDDADHLLFLYILNQLNEYAIIIKNNWRVGLWIAGQTTI